MKLTLLEYVQSIASSLGSDEVNSISDTVESMQIAEIVKTTYFNTIVRAGLPEHTQLLQLTAPTDPTTPVLMYLPAGIGKVDWIKYFNSNVLNNPPTTSTHGINTDIVTTQTWTTTSSTTNTIGNGTKTFTVASNSLPVTMGQPVSVQSGANSMTGTLTSYIGTTMVLNITSFIGSGTFSSWLIESSTGSPVPGYQYVTMLPNKQFLDMVLSNNPQDSNVQSFTFQDNSNQFPGSFTFYYRNDRQPSFCTIISDYYIVFDSYDSAVDDTLQSSKTMCEGSVIPAWVMSDTFIPNIDESQVPLLLNDAKSLAFFELKQTIHTKAEQESKRQWSSVQRDKSVFGKPTYFEQLPDFGRNSRSSYATMSFFKLKGWDRP